MRAILPVLALLSSYMMAAAEQTEISFYGGMNATADSRVSGSDPGGAGLIDFFTGWVDPAASGPSQYGVRLTWWRNQSLGWGLDFSSVGSRAQQNTLAANGINELEFSNNINLVTVNAYRRWQDTGNLRPYVGAGFGLAIPKVEFEAGNGRTSQLQVTGPALQMVAGASYPIGGNLSVFGEYKGSISLNNADLVSGGEFTTVTQNNGINVGVSLGF